VAMVVVVLIMHLGQVTMLNMLVVVEDLVMLLEML
jgi:hypothetical protein